MSKDLSILVVDDFATMRRIVKSQLNELGYTNVDEADDGATALPLLQTGKYQFLITDWNMPTMSGLDLLKNVRANPSIMHIPVMMITAEAKRDNIIEAAKAGVNGYIVKPFNSKALKEKITAVLSRM
ncbi:response regulator [Photobacterium kishitanii]|jgi:two-component system chemotaxis response regulator CheY|uniref:chemotaxis response regulator CheY n=1 Tax=Photobacterium kishitanii TaxID=318456 RepID=UPI00043226B4|nr:chemotaxis response regulator CheY [Photobacterium kishitanii]PSU85072.1 response regulator [Photobacterium kishitanii]PSU94249.1 response regulator [Photobacterium kishitanii]PSV04629.1 response regulator [Photobacterium kishitanii]PSV14340.1 response regulator [Photobacterium kishitanii]PSW57662.1 response regulator [Photobacterium kishitanii]